MADFKLDEHPNCPECGKELDDAPARDFIVWGMDKQPKRTPSKDRCGWCDAWYVARFKAPDMVSFEEAEGTDDDEY